MDSYQDPGGGLNPATSLQRIEHLLAKPAESFSGAWRYNGIWVRPEMTADAAHLMGITPEDCKRWHLQRIREHELSTAPGQSGLMVASEGREDWSRKDFPWSTPTFAPQSANFPSSGRHLVSQPGCEQRARNEAETYRDEIDELRETSRLLSDEIMQNREAMARLRGEYNEERNRAAQLGREADELRASIKRTESSTQNERIAALESELRDTKNANAAETKYLVDQIGKRNRIIESLKDKIVLSA